MEPNKSTNENNYIQNIYNFCDRQCQKCGFTTICEASTESNNTKTEDEKNKLFWKEIEDKLPESLKIITKITAKKQLSLTELDTPTQKKTSISLGVMQKVM